MTDDDDYQLPPELSYTSTLDQIKDWLVPRMFGRGAKCPCCERLAKVHPRPLNASNVQVLILLYRRHGQDWAYLPDLRSAGQDESTAKHWGLIEPRPGLRADGAKQQGWWRLTNQGVRFVRGEITIPRRMMIFADRSYGPQDANNQVSIQDCLGINFDYDKLMRGEL
jgi:hypothetical protein